MNNTFYRNLNILGSSAIYLGFLYLLRDTFGFSKVFIFMLSALINILGYTAIITWFINGKQRELDRKSRILWNFWVFVATWMLIVPFLFYDYSFGLEKLNQGLTQDYRYVMFTSLAFVFVTPGMKKYYFKIMRNIGILAIITGVIGLILVNKSLSAIVTRNLEDSTSYVLWWFSGTIFAYWYFRAYLEKSSRWGYIVVFVYVLLGLFFLKRSPFVSLMVLFIITVLYDRNVKYFLRIVTLLVLLMFIGGNLIKSPINLLLERFNKTYTNIDEWDRLKEIDVYYSNITLKYVLIGHGLSNYFVMDHLNKNFEINALHIGLRNYQYKGGVPYMLFLVVLVYYIWILYRNRYADKEAFIAACVGFIFVAILFYEGSWTYTPEPFFFLAPILSGLKFCTKNLST